MNNSLVAAQERYDEKAKSKILGLIQREKDRLYWYQLNYSMSKPRGHSVRVAQTSTLDGLVIKYNNQRLVQEAI